MFIYSNAGLAGKPGKLQTDLFIKVGSQSPQMSREVG